MPDFCIPRVLEEIQASLKRRAYFCVAALISAANLAPVSCSSLTRSSTPAFDAVPPDVAGVKSLAPATGAAAESTLASKMPLASAAKASIFDSTAAESIACRVTDVVACLGAVKARAGAASKAMESFMVGAARGRALGGRVRRLSRISSRALHALLA